MNNQRTHDLLICTIPGSDLRLLPFYLYSNPVMLGTAIFPLKEETAMHKV